MSMSRWNSIYSYLLNLIMTCLGRGGSTGAGRPGRPGPPPRAARGGCGGARPRQVWALCTCNSRVGAYAAVFRAVSAHAPGWLQKTHNSPAHPTSPVSGRSAHGGRSHVFCSALAARYWANTNNQKIIFAKNIFGFFFFKRNCFF